VVVDLCTDLVAISKEYWEKLAIKSRSTIFLCLLDSVLLNVSREDTAKKLWENLENLYYSKSLVDKLFM
jgi:hypothetical protein